MRIAGWNIKISKKLKIASLLIVIILVGVMLDKLNRRSNGNITVNNLQPTTTSSQVVSMPLYPVETKPKFSPNNQQFVSLHINKTAHAYTVDLMCNILYKNIDDLQNTYVCFSRAWPIKDWDAKKIEFKNTIGEKNIAWSAQSDKLAMLTPTKLDIFYFNKTITTPYQSPIQKHISLDNPDIGYDNTRIFFSGDGNELYVNRLYKSILKVDLSSANPKFEKIDFESSQSNVYPIPHSPGFALVSTNPPHGKVMLELHKGTTIAKFDLEGWQMDGYDKFEFSDDLSKVCIEGGSSGYQGYNIYDLNRSKTLQVGKQYSFCGKWLDTNRIIVKEALYGIDSTDYPHYYIFDTSTLQKNPILDSSQMPYK